MSNTEWKKGYEEGFAAGWKAANITLDYKKYLPVCYGGTDSKSGVYNISQTSKSGVYDISQFNTMADSATVRVGNNTKTVLLSEDC